jgi:hypothetical protein
MKAYFVEYDVMYKDARLDKPMVEHVTDIIDIDDRAWLTMSLLKSLLSIPPHLQDDLKIAWIGKVHKVTLL